MLIDSNIIIYSINKNSPKNLQAIKFLEEDTTYYFSHQTILESLRILTHPKFDYKEDGNKVLTQVYKIANSGIIINPTNLTINLFKQLIERYKLKANKIFDAYFVATALSNGIDVIATDNERHFKKFKEIQVYNPFKQ